MKRIRVSRRFAAPPEQVFRAWVDPALAGRWLFATAARRHASVEIDARVDGGFRFVDRRPGGTTEYRGEYREIASPRRLVFALAGERARDAASRVVVDIAPLAQGCRLTITHDDVPAERGPDVENRWAGMLYGLGTMLE